MNHISKKELKETDQFTAAGRNVFAQILKNQKLVILVALTLFVSGAGYVVWDKVRLSKELKIQEEFYIVEKSYLKLKESFDKAEADQKVKTNKEDSKKDLVKGEIDKKSLPTGDLSKDYGSAVEGWNKLIDSHSSSKAAAIAALELSQLYLKYKAPKEALQVLLKVKNQHRSDHFLGAMVYHSYAKLLSNQGQCQEAVQIWENLEKGKRFDFLIEQAQLGRALCLESLGQTEKAEMIYKDIVKGKDTPMTPSKAASPPKAKSQTQRLAEKYLRHIKIKKSVSLGS